MTSPGVASGGSEAAGTLQALGAAVLWGSSGIFSVLLFRRGVSPEAVALYRPLTATAFLAVWILLRDRAALWPGPRDAAWLWLLGGGVTALFQLAYQLSTEAVGVPATVGMLYLAPLLVMLAGGPLLGEPPGRRQVIWGLVAVAGVWAVVAGARGADVELTGRGLAWGLTTAVGYAGYTLFGRWGARRWAPLPTVFHCYVGASVVLAVALPLTAGRTPGPADPEAWGLLAAYGFLTITVAVVLFYTALRTIPAARASIAATVEPVVAATLAAALLGQHLTPWGWTGLVLVVAGVAGAVGRPRVTPPAEPS